MTTVDSLNAVEGVRYRGLVTVRLALLHTEGTTAVRVEHFGRNEQRVFDRFWILTDGQLKPGQAQDITAYVAALAGGTLAENVPIEGTVF